MVEVLFDRLHLDHNRSVLNLRAIQDMWKKMLDPLTKPEIEHTENRWRVKIVHDTGSLLTDRSSVSSGENQLLFLLALIEGYRAHGSLLILDEPELHLSLKASYRLLSSLREFSKSHETQMLIITHMPSYPAKPALYTSGKGFDWESGSQDTGADAGTALIYIKGDAEPLYGYQAWETVQRESRDEIQQLVESLRIDVKHIGIAGVKASFISDCKKFLALVRDRETSDRLRKR